MNKERIAELKDLILDREQEIRETIDEIELFKLEIARLELWPDKLQNKWVKAYTIKCNKTGRHFGTWFTLEDAKEDIIRRGHTNVSIIDNKVSRKVAEMGVKHDW